MSEKKNVLDSFVMSCLVSKTNLQYSNSTVNCSNLKICQASQAMSTIRLSVVRPGCRIVFNKSSIDTFEFELFELRVEVEVI